MRMTNGGRREKENKRQAALGGRGVARKKKEDKRIENESERERRRNERGLGFGRHNGGTWRKVASSSSSDRK